MRSKTIVLVVLILSSCIASIAQAPPQATAAPKETSPAQADDAPEVPQAGQSQLADVQAQTVGTSINTDPAAALVTTCNSLHLVGTEALDLQASSTTVFTTDARPSVKAFSGFLARIFEDCLNNQPDAVMSLDLRNLRFPSNIRSATSMLNPGLSELTFAAASSQAYQSLPDKQTSAQPGSSGSTSLVSKNAGAAILAFAVDSGALTESVSGTTTTVSGNLEGIGSLLTGKSPISINPAKQSPWRTIAGTINLTGTFALAQPSAQTTTDTQPATGTSPSTGTEVSFPSSVGKLTGLTAQFNIHNRFDPHSATFRKNWEANKPSLNAAAPEILKASSTVMLALECAACKAEWPIAIAGINQGLGAKNPRQVADAFDSYVAALLAHAKAADPNFDADVVNAVKATSQYQNAVKAVVNNTVGNLLTLQYDFFKPVSQPESHTFKFVYGNVPSGQTGISSILSAGSGAKSLFTANLGINIYGGAIPASAKYGRLHYGQASVEFDRPIALISSSVPAVFSLAGYWQYQPTASVLNITQGDVAPGTTIDAPTQVLVGTAGSLWVTQAKITLGKGRSGVTVPIGVKWSNKTDLLTGNKIGGQVGISYDLSSLSSLFGGGN